MYDGIDFSDRRSKRQSCYLVHPSLGPDGLSSNQRRLLRFIADRINRGLSPPNLREIAEEFGWKAHNSSVLKFKSLERKGYLCRAFNESRSHVPIVVPHEDGTGTVVIEGVEHTGKLTHNGDFWTIDARDS